MSRAQPKSSPTDEHARRIAQAIAKGRPPPFNDAFDRYCESSPREIFAAFTGAARHMPPAGKDESLAIGYLFLLQRLLEHLRYRTDRGYADAARLIADFQADVVAQVEAGNVDGRMLAGVAVGLARYLNVDVTLVRVVLVVLAFVGGAGVPLYLAGWLLMPDEATGRSFASEIIDWLREGR